MRPVVLSVAGSDCSGGAGIQADLKAIEANGGFAATVLTAVTVQNSRGVDRVEALDAILVEEQLEAVMTDLPVAAVKSGVLATAGAIDALSRALDRHRPAHFVLDPVLAAESGWRMLPAECLDLLRRRLIPLASLVTPNVPEAEALSGTTVHSLEEAEQAAQAILRLGAGAVLVKGGHLSSAPATDLLVTPAFTRVFDGTFLRTPHARGTGCIYASSIATRLAQGAEIVDAVGVAKAFVARAIRHGLALGKGRGPADAMHELHHPRTEAGQR